MVGLVNKDAQLLQAAQLLESLIGCQFAFFLGLVEVVEIGGIGIYAVGGEGFAGRAEQLVD